MQISGRILVAQIRRTALGRLAARILATARHLVLFGGRADRPRSVLSVLAGGDSIVSVRTCARSARQYLRHPHLAHQLSAGAGTAILDACVPGAEVQVVIGNGLSDGAPPRLPELLVRLVAGCAERGWTSGRPIAVDHCGTGVIGDIGALLEPTVLILLIAERPEDCAPQKLSVHVAYRPRPGSATLVSRIGPGDSLGTVAQWILSAIGTLLAAGRREAARRTGPAPGPGAQGVPCEHGQAAMRSPACPGHTAALAARAAKPASASALAYCSIGARRGPDSVWWHVTPRRSRAAREQARRVLRTESVSRRYQSGRDRRRGRGV